LCLLNDNLISGSGDKTVCWWDLSNPENNRILINHSNDILCMGVIYDRIVTGGSDKIVRLWDIDNPINSR